MKVFCNKSSSNLAQFVVMHLTTIIPCTVADYPISSSFSSELNTKENHLNETLPSNVSSYFVRDFCFYDD